MHPPGTKGGYPSTGGYTTGYSTGYSSGYSSGYSGQQMQQMQQMQQNQQMPPPVPPFSRPRPSYPPKHEHEYEEERRYGRGRERYHSREVAMRACFDMMRRRYNEMPADPAQNFPTHSELGKGKGAHPTGVPADILRVDYVDFRPQENAKDHRTFHYELVQDHDRPTPVFRRGQAFYMSLVTRERDFDCTRDNLYLNFYFGPNPSVPKRTRIVLPVTIQKEFSKAPQKWDCRIHAQDSRNLTLQVHIPATCPVGVWRCVVETATRNYPKARTQYRAPEDMFVIFNPFCRDDAVYMENDAQRSEFVMNDTGKVYLGGSKNTHGRPWVYGQFDDCVLPAACVLLEMSRLTHAERGNPVKVSRALCAMIQSSRNHRRDYEDTDGMLEPYYEDDHRGGQNPHLWTGSVKIIEEFLWQGATPVKFGHCWVMSALLTTFLRTLGMSARPTTVITSAHETQDTLTIDRYVDRFGDIIERGPGRDQPDAVWAFHTWCDVWMTRPDLPSGYSGWQALDPARSYFRDRYSNGCGPSSAEAVKKGDVGYSYETSALFSALNTFVRYFYEDDDSEWGYTHYRQYRFPMCRSIMTKAVGRHDDDGEGDCEDVTKTYKDMERSEPERFTVFNACRGMRKDHVYYDYQDQGSYDVTFELVDPQRVAAGQSMTVTLQVHNNSSETRTVQATISTRSAFYTGVMGAHLKRVTGQFTLAGGQRDTLTLRLDASEYQDRLVDMGFIKVTASGFVNENKQSYIDEHDFQFEKPRMSIEVAECQVGQECTATFSFSNPLDVPLTDCFFSMEVGGACRPRTMRVNREVRPRETFTYTQTFVPRRSGDRRLVAAFTSRQLHDITGSRKLTIRD
ncbi:hemocyte protein-glutamine gamma-glutamyltransferase-like isoform X3 [Penaeus chinensis]|uniref:hemocyte protein-glutamine gamma-glutamyltransferase-like isoform X3 n=1 Tax=Penaeus chinensis TaxID=139456 RepID=UPI001FB656C0|nr:hemocyte protein-glutamine gamma-glutamyltransferase-like isoform X3 [Penaeus chinensis]